MDRAPMLVTVIAEARNYDELHEGICVLADERNISRNDLDKETGLADGYCGKVMGPAQVKRISDLFLGLVLGGLRAKLLLVEDEEAWKRFGPLPARERPKERSPNAPRVRPRLRAAEYQKLIEQPELRSVLSELGRVGAEVLHGSRTPAERSEVARHAARARWRRPRRSMTNPKKAAEGNR